MRLNMYIIFLGASEQPIYKRNENLDQKISLYSGDITKLEIDAIVNAGKSVPAVPIFWSLFISLNKYHLKTRQH